MSTQPLLIEIGVEELPALPLLKILDRIEASWKKVLQEHQLSSDFSFDYTPRRLVLRHNAIPLAQEDRVEELVGPPVEIAIKEGKPTPAGEGFARKCGVAFEQLDRTHKGNREVLYYRREVPGSQTRDLLPEMIREWVASMNFGKMMRWGDRHDEFIRPVRWLQVRLGQESVPAELFGVASGTRTFVHRMVSFDPVEVPDPAKFEEILQKGEVTLRADERRRSILEDFDTIEAESGLKIERDGALLDEVVAITEHPKALLGTFDEKFLELPPEVIMTSMKEHQRYFPVFDGEGRLSNHFVVVSNAVTENYSQVIAGNERVLRPRLEDALFFYRNDLKRGLSIEGLEKIQFIDGLGTLKDKVDRERNIALRLAGIYMDKLEQETGRSALEIEELMDRAVTLAKADLLTEMVYEFTELQGLMGYYYAKALGEDPLVCTAIKEQYRPEGEGAELPSTIFSSILAMAIKLDTLLGLFSVGKIPTGSKDPFALRRAVNGIIRIVTRYDLSFDIPKMMELLADQYAPFDEEKLESFILERIYKSLKANPSIIAAVLATGERDVNEIAKKVAALRAILEQEGARELFTTFKRVANISAEVDLDGVLEVDPELFEAEEERKLWEAFRRTREREYGDYQEELQALFALKPLLDAFFDSVLVNAEEEKLRLNRQAMVASIYKTFLNIADLKEISV
ncbi:glycine--tRNA ligase subunit beta [Nitratifractor salsuginis]|uniref:Glycine--tRNA ligase beta subunit n=1 Tax=Nitratifractor salsuginis (strain DSM 16511 / JCM 12458 / E9I37-1) TaxID=749222 RepID=E6X1X0_NITSE|nr:glycine--tRNA ligase subunit beta [Nitratifractor salsuginis]ADV45978.1 glycyl-tRNA synthetase beta chain [Nitratifractor salsuginis DSM 16511]